MTVMSATRLQADPAGDKPIVAPAMPVAADPGYSPNPLLIGAPSDPAYATKALTIKVVALPTDGSVCLAGGSTALTVGETLTVAQLTGLVFEHPWQWFQRSSTFTYIVADPAGQTASGSVSLTDGPRETGVPELAPASGDTINGITTTSQPSPTFVGTGTPGNEVILYFGPQSWGIHTSSFAGFGVVGTGLVDNQGNWSITVAGKYGGSFDVSAEQVDPAGNVSQPSERLSIFWDNLAASTTMNQTASEGITGPIGADSEAVYIGDATDLPNGTFVWFPAGTTYTYRPSTELSAGRHTLTAIVLDVHGDQSHPSPPLTFIVAADHSYTIDSEAAGNAVVSQYSNQDVLQARRFTQPYNTVVTQDFGAGGVLIHTSTARSVYDSAGSLIATVQEAGTASGIAPAGFLSTPVTGGASIVTDALPSLVQLLAGTQRLLLNGPDTVLAGSGDDTVFAGRLAASVSGGSGRLAFQGGAGASMVTGGSGSATISGGAGGGSYAGGAAGGSLLSAGGGNTTLIGAGGNDKLFAGSGDTTMLASSAGFDTLVGGSGADTIILGSGQDAVFAGIGADRLEVMQGDAGGLDVIAGFKVGTDSIDLSGYPAPPRIVIAGGNTTVDLSDGTAITLLGITHLAAGSLL